MTGVWPKKPFFMHCDRCNDLIVDVDDFICEKTHEPITGERVVECKMRGEYSPTEVGDD